MNTRKTCIILTEDYFLYLGIKHLARHFDCILSDFSGELIEHDTFTAPVILVDLRIILQKNWDGFDRLKKNHPHSIFVRLFHRSIFGFICSESCFHRDDYHIKNLILGNASTFEKENRRYDNFATTHLTPLEQKIIPHIAKGKNIAALSAIFQCSVKTLYTHRTNISSKLGLRHPAYLSFFLEKISFRFFDIQV